MSISNDLFQMAGLFDKHRTTGGAFTSEEASAMAGRLEQLAEGAAALELSLKNIADEFDRYIEDQHRDMPIGAIPTRKPHSLAIIEGGRA